METQRAILAIVISFVIIYGYQYFFVAPNQPQENAVETAETIEKPMDIKPSAVESPKVQEQEAVVVAESTKPSRSVLDVNIETELYSAIVSEQGGGVKSFVLKKHRESNAEDSPGKQLIRTDASVGYPLKFSWGSLVPENLLYTSSTQRVNTVAGKESDSLVLSVDTGKGIAVERVYTFFKDKYYMDMKVTVKNTSSYPLQGAAQVHQVNTPFQTQTAMNRFLFSGPAIYVNEEFQQIDPEEFEAGPKTIQGNVSWAGYQGTYFMCSVAPLATNGVSFSMEGNENLVKTTVTSALDTLQPGEEKVYAYRVFYGPKKLTLLDEAGDNFSKAVNFGFFDVIAKPTLWLLNFFNKYVHNYGVAIILVTVLFKVIFWPITQKGLKSMKNMQKLQPKMVKLKEKYKDDPAQMNREVMNLYKTYKVNPLGGCLPMLLQIPVFFALYKVLLQSIELRHAPFMLWITDLSAPDRLMVGFDIPFLGGIPVLTLLMGASMFIQQKLTPSTADPTQQRIMMFLPVVFTFMFLNFASGLVLYWFVNNLLAILQQQLINRQSKSIA